MKLAAQAKEYSYSLKSYQNYKRLPGEWFSTPNHLSYVADDMSDFDQTIRELEPEQVFWAEEGDLYRAKVRLCGAFSVGDLGSVEWLDVREPTQAQLARRATGVRSLTFILGSLLGASDILKAKRVTHEPFFGNNRGRIVVPFGRAGESFELANQPFEEIVRLQVEAKDLRALPPSRAA